MIFLITESFNTQNLAENLEFFSTPDRLLVITVICISLISLLFSVELQSILLKNTINNLFD